MSVKIQEAGPNSYRINAESIYIIQPENLYIFMDNRDDVQWKYNFPLSVRIFLCPLVQPGDLYGDNMKVLCSFQNITVCHLKFLS